MITYAIIQRSFYGGVRSYKKTFNDDKHFQNWWSMMNRKGVTIVDVFEIKN
jgi:hypothetical protein